uniref:PRL2-20 n=1 Tax=Streptomyces sp. 44414 TaxID=364103 RepID=Q2LET2_9ACTN|nr:hypothetical protein [Streptomyces sp. 44414]ABC67383.1 pRL2-20 [Streptomyces sp. 44414]
MIDEHSSSGDPGEPGLLEAIQEKAGRDRQPSAGTWSPTMLSSTATPEEISNELERRGQVGRLVANSNGGTRRKVVVPTDLDRWHPDEITRWLSRYEADETVSAADLDRARSAAADALNARPEGVNMTWKASVLSDGYISTPEEFEALRQAATTIEIPADLPRWHPNEIGEWMDSIAEDETASHDDRRRAVRVVAYALGIEPEDQEASQ